MHEAFRLGTQHSPVQVNVPGGHCYILREGCISAVSGTYITSPAAVSGGGQCWGVGWAKGGSTSEG